MFGATSQFIARLKAVHWLIVSLTFSGFIFLLQAPWDPEPHHDGIMFTAAFAASKGMIANRDYFTQYGPLTPEIQGLWLHLTDPTLLNLRIFTALLLTLSAGLLFWTTYKFLGSKLAFLIAVGWSLSTPKILPTNLPWSSIFSTLLILVVMLLIPHAMAASGVKQKFCGGLIGFLLFMGGFIRIQMWLNCILLILAILILRRRDGQTLVINGFVGGVVGLVISVSVMHWLGMYSSWFSQCISWAIHAYSGPKPDIKAQIVNTLLPLSFFYFSFIFIAYLKLTQRIRNKLFPSAGLGIFLLALSQIGRIPLDYKLKSFRNPKYMLIWQSENVHYLLNDLAIFAVLYFAYEIIRYKLKTISLANLMYVALGLGTLTQLYPSPDALHLWWIVPVCFAAVAPLLPDRMERLFGPGWQKSTGFAIGVLIFSLLVNLGISASETRVRYTDPILSGMRGSANSPTEETMLLLAKYGRTGSVDMQCQNGLFASAGGRYLASSGAFVNWGPRGNDINQTSSTQRFFCFISKPFSSQINLDKWNKIFEIESEIPGQYNVLFEKY
jgi:hypothetical protein